MNDSKDRVWAYLHSEMPQAEKLRFEQSLAYDSDLRKTLEECQTLHQELGLLGDDLAEERLLDEWESEHPEFREKPKYPHNRILRFSLTLAAAAAAIVLLLALPLNQGPVRWQHTSYGSPPQLRGEAGEEPRYSRTELKKVNRDLQENIESGIAELPAPTKPWKLRIHLQELANGYLAVEIFGHPRDNPEEQRHWNETFQGRADFDAKVPGFAQGVVDDMAERKGP